MSRSPVKSSGFTHLPPPQEPPSSRPQQSPRAARTIRKLQSAHNLSSAAAATPNPPSLIAQHRQQLLRLQQQHRTGADFSPKDFSLQPPAGLEPVKHGRSRSNSDAAINRVSQDGPAARHTTGKKPVTPVGTSTGRRMTLDGLLRDGPLEGDRDGAVREMRYRVLTDGVISDSDGMSTLRIYIWLILLSAPPLATDDYLALVHRGASSAYSKIRNDTFRTLATDPLFRRRVSEASLIRVLNAIAWKLHDAKLERPPPSASAAGFNFNVSVGGSPELYATSPPVNLFSTSKGSNATGADASEAGGRTEPGTYVQGMNVMAAPFLYVARSEAEAYIAFHRFLTREVPGYVRGAMDGVHRGLALVDKVLAIVDPKLAQHLLSKGMHAELYAFPSVLTLCACTPPLPEVLHLWDFLFAYGAHLNLLCIVAQLVMIRDAILESP
ncbi:MAG: hypothetical protein M4579_007197, partial [Chaenotheca gracillima]